MITFDQSLPLLVDVIAETWGESSITKSVFLRDALGRLTFVVLDGERNAGEREKLSEIVSERLGGYADPSGISVATPEELFDDSLKVEGNGTSFPIDSPHFQGVVRVVDRRVVGADWLRPPKADTLSTPRLFFVSLKGGVGRSTALCVLAAHLASSGRRVLAIDLDLEAPGLGTMLLDSSTLPKYGLLDYLVESNLAAIDDVFFTDMVAFSSLAGGRGSIAVVPALGALASNSPLNVLAKLARAYLPSDTSPDLNGFTDKIERLIDHITSEGDFDVVLVDARAGLHESTAAAAVALRGTTLVFGMDQPQTYAGYRALLAQLALTLGPQWSNRIHLVEAKADGGGPSDEFVSNMMEILPELHTKPTEAPVDLAKLRTTFEVEWDDASSDDLVDSANEQEIGSTYIIESSAFAKFDPLKHPDRLSRGMYAAVYGAFLQACEEIIDSTDVFKRKS